MGGAQHDHRRADGARPHPEAEGRASPGHRGVPAEQDRDLTSDPELQELGIMSRQSPHDSRTPDSAIVYGQHLDADYRILERSCRCGAARQAAGDAIRLSSGGSRRSSRACGGMAIGRCSRTRAVRRARWADRGQPQATSRSAATLVDAAREERRSPSPRGTSARWREKQLPAGVVGQPGAGRHDRAARAAARSRRLLRARRAAIRCPRLCS